MFDFKRAALDRRPCPHCGASRHVKCWSAFLGRRMENEVHADRLYPQAGRG